MDPLKDQQAEILAITNNLKSRSMVVAEAGYDAEEIDRQIAADQSRATALGIAPATLVPPSPAPEDPANV